MNIAITGNSGIGKSRFYLYCIYRFINEMWKEKKLVFKGENKYWLYADGHFLELSDYDVMQLMDDPNVIRLIDGKSSTLNCWKGVSILFASPGIHDYKTFPKSDKHKEYLMPVWTHDELVIANSYMKAIDSEILERRYKLFGGIARFVFGRAEDFEAEINEAIYSDDCLKLFNHVAGKRKIEEKH